MKRVFIILSLVVVANLAVTPTFAITAGNETKPRLSVKQETQYQELKVNTSNFFGTIHKQFVVPNFLFGKPLFKSQNVADSYEQMIDGFFKSYPDLFQVPLSDFTVQIERPKNRDITQAHLVQYYQNVPVFGGEAVDIT